MAKKFGFYEFSEKKKIFEVGFLWKGGGWMLFLIFIHDFLEEVNAELAVRLGNLGSLQFLMLT